MPQNIYAADVRMLDSSPNSASTITSTGKQPVQDIARRLTKSPSPFIVDFPACDAGGSVPPKKEQETSFVAGLFCRL